MGGEKRELEWERDEAEREGERERGRERGKEGEILKLCVCVHDAEYIGRLECIGRPEYVGRPEAGFPPY